MTGLTGAGGRLRGIRSIASWQVTLGVALLALGFLIATQLRTEVPRVRYASTERIPLVETANGLQTQQNGLKQDLLRLRQQVQDLETQGQGSAATATSLNHALEQARVASGLTAIVGPGLVLQLRDSTQAVPPGNNPTDYAISARDVRTVVEQLWLAGAEAVAVNGERVTGSSAIIDIGGSTLVNAAYLAPPYQVAAVGPPDLFDKLNGLQGFRDFVKTRVEAFGLDVSFAELADVTIPAYAGTINLRYAHPAASAKPQSVPSTAGPGGAGSTTGPGGVTP